MGFFISAYICRMFGLGIAYHRVKKILIPQERIKFWLLVVLHVVMNILDIVALAAVIYIINIYTREKPILRKDLIPDWLLHRNILTPFLLLVVFFIVKSVAGFLILRFQNKYLYGVATRLSMERYQFIVQDAKKNVLEAAAIRAVSQVPVEFTEHVLLSVKQVFSEIILISMAGVALMIFKTKLFLLILLIVLPVTVIIYFSTTRLLKRLRSSIQQNSLKTIQYIQQAIQQKSVEENDTIAEAYLQSQQSLNMSRATFHTLQALPNRFFDAALVASLFLLVFLTKQLEHIRYIDVVTIGSFMAAAAKVIPGIIRLINLNAEIQSYAYTIDVLQDGTTDEDTHVDG